MPLLYSSTRRPSPLRDVDYDHEISLVDHTSLSSPKQSRSGSATSIEGCQAKFESSSRRRSDAPLHKLQTPLHLREGLKRRKFAKYQNRGVVAGADGTPADVNTLPDTETCVGEEEYHDDGEQVRGRTVSKDQKTKKKKIQEDSESAIDVLYENQRGGFLCGIPLFSAKALGNLDPAPWTNIAQKPSATDITNAQVPDPSWQWAGKGWTINHTDLDEDGWEYSFAFHGKFSWHRAKWWNSFVRRRAWIRKRFRKGSGYRANDTDILGSEYFTMRSTHIRSSSRVSTDEQRYSGSYLIQRENEDDEKMQDICDIGTLMTALRKARIDREKMEAMENFIKNGGENVYYLKEKMHNIMCTFMFQTSRHLLLSHLLRVFKEASGEEYEHKHSSDDVAARKKRLEYLEAAIKTANEEVQSLEYWSDVKDMAESRLPKGAIDKFQGRDIEAGFDKSGLNDIISEPKLLYNGKMTLSTNGKERAVE